MSDLLNHINPTPREKELIRQYTNALESISRVAEERDSLRTQLKSLEGDCAVMREALQYSKSHNHRDNFKGRVSCKGHECPVCDALTNALSTSAGKSLLDKLSGYEKRLVEAERLLSEMSKAYQMTELESQTWENRRDAWLKGVKSNE